MDLEKLKAEHPDLVQQIRQEAMEEGRKAERERINALEDLAMPGFASLLSEAKADSSITPEAFAVKMVKRRRLCRRSPLMMRRMTPRVLKLFCKMAIRVFRNSRKLKTRPRWPQ